MFDLKIDTGSSKFNPLKVLSKAIYLFEDQRKLLRGWRLLILDFRQKETSLGLR